MDQKIELKPCPFCGKNRFGKRGTGGLIMAKYVKLKTVWKMLHGLGGCGAEPESWADGWDKAVDTAINELEKMPAADVQEVKHGKWKKKNTSSYFSCSRCGYEEMRETNYCSYCGAKMDGKR